MEYPEEVPLTIPLSLQQRLEDDCYWVHSRGKLVSLPADTSVSTILRLYYQYSLTHASQDTNFGLLAEMLDGLKVYFDFTLGDHLLYSQEKSQYKQLCDSEGFGRATVVNKVPQAHITHPQKKDITNHAPSTPHTPHTYPSDCYGVEHLLRLFVRLPHFLSRANLPPTHVHTLHTYIKDLLEYLTNQDGLFSEEHYRDNSVPCANGILDPTATEQ